MSMREYRYDGIGFYTQNVTVWVFPQGERRYKRPSLFL